MKKFSEYLKESDTRVIVKKKDHYDKDHKAFDVHYDGKHIGHVSSYGTTAERKKNSVRMTDTGKRRTKWRYDQKTPGMRGGSHMSSKKDAVDELVLQHKRSLGEETYNAPVATNSTGPGIQNFDPLLRRKKKVIRRKTQS